MCDDKETIPVLWACGVRGSFFAGGDEFDGFGHDTSCFALRVGSHGVIVDCGTGLRLSEALLGDCARIDVLFTHFHYDHVLGLFSAPWLLCRGKNVHLWGYAPGSSVRAVLSGLATPPYWPVPLPLDACHFHDIGPGDAMTLGDGIAVRTMAANHPNHGLLYRVNTGEKSVVFAFDHEQGASDGELAAFASRCDLLIYDGMFTAAECERYAGWGHSSCEHGLRLMRDAQAQRLLITHHGFHRTDAELERMERDAQRRSDRCAFAREGDIYRL